MMPISEDSGDAVASSQQLPTSLPSNLGRPLFSSKMSVSLTPHWLNDASSRHRRSWQFKGRGSLCFLSSVLLIMSILPLIGKICSKRSRKSMNDIIDFYMLIDVLFHDVNIITEISISFEMLTNISTQCTYKTLSFV